MPTIQIPRQLRQHADHQESVMIPGDSLIEVVLILVNKYPALKPYLIDQQSQKLCGFISIYLNGKDIRFLDNETTPLNENDILSIIPAIAGG
jgi:molybdopterin converting factor small subunit